MFTKSFEKKAGPVNMSLGQTRGAAFAAGMAGANQPSGWENLKAGIGSLFGSNPPKPPVPPPGPVNVAAR